MKTLYIKDLERNLLITGETFALSEVEKAEDKNGKLYYKVLLGDKTGKLSGKIWNDKINQIDLKALTVAQIVQIQAKVEEYQGKLQLNIYQLSGVDESKLDEFLESSEYDSDEMMAELLNEVEMIKHNGIKKVLKNVFSDEEVLRKFKYAVAAKSIHHDFRSGLIQHVLEMITISKSLKRFYPNLNYDILTAGIILHDIGKIQEMDSTGLSTNYTKAGGLVGHIVLGIMILEQYGGKELPEDYFLHISHLILSHHGALEMGSPVLPSTPEALALTYLDNLSSKIRASLQEISKIPKEKEFSNPYMFLQNARLWKGSNNDLDLKNNTSVVKEGEQLSLD